MLYALCASRSPSSYFTHDSTCFIVMIFSRPIHQRGGFYQCVIFIIIFMLKMIHQSQSRWIHVLFYHLASRLLNCTFFSRRYHRLDPKSTTIGVHQSFKILNRNCMEWWQKKRWNVICREHNHIRMMNFNLIETKNVRVMQIDMRCVLRSKPKADISRHLPQYRPILSNHLNGNKKQKSQ